MVALRPCTAPVRRPSSGSRGSRPQSQRELAPGEVQRIWVYCQDLEEQQDIFSCCRGSTRPHMCAEAVERSNINALQGPIRNLLSSLPAPYGPNEWPEFWEDVGVLLAASVANGAHVRAQKQAERGSRAARWPPLLVTDRAKLCEASTSLELRQAIAEAGRLHVWELLPVVLSSNFGLLSGLLVEGEPLEVCSSRALRPPPLAAAGPPGEGASTEASKVELRSGVFLQLSGPTGDGSAADAGDASPGLYGARYLALLGDGRCAYCAVSPDGARSVEASGAWEIVNGNVVVGGAGGRATVRHFRLSQGAAEVLPEVCYAEPVHISLEELSSAFRKPVPLAELAPRRGEILRSSLVEAGAIDSPATRRAADRPGEAGRCSPPSLDRSGTLGRGSGRGQGGAGAPAAAPLSDVAADGGAEEESLERQRLLRTPMHALMTLAGAEAAAAERSREQEHGPRLLGFQRGLTVNGSRLAEELSSECSTATRARDALRPSPAVQLAAYAPLFSQPVQEEAFSLATCPLRPGSYLYQSGCAADLSQRSAELLLRADGSCHYREESQGSSIRSIAGAAVWRVEGLLLILETLQSGMYGFLHREVHGNRSLERKVARVELSVVQVLSCCQHTPFAQLGEPFPEHSPLSASRRMFGLVDLDSPALQDMRCRPDRIPYHAFEHELRRRGLPVDEILSDFRFIDRDADGQISLADMRLLEGYGTPASAPEVLHDLLEALVRCFGSPQQAFEVLKASAGPRKVSEEEFEKFLQQNAVEHGPHGDSSKLKEWVEKTSVEDRAAVFASLNPSGNPVIDLADFLSLHLHTAVLAVRRLEHFQSWLFEQFGRTEEVFRQVFNALNAERAQVLVRKAFVDGAEALGYPAGPKATGSMFSLLDRNLDGEVSLRDFQRLRDFSAEQLLMSLGAFKSFVDKHLGGIDASFRKILEREQALQGLPSLPKTASFAALEKVCKQAGFGKAAPDADLKMLFLFLAEASGRHSTGYLTSSEWALLKGFTSRALTGSPARLRRILEAEYGGIDQAFQHMHTAWLERALVLGLQQTALAGLGHALFGPASGSSEAPRSSKSQPTTARRAQSAHGPRCLGPSSARPPSRSRPAQAHPGSAKERLPPTLKSSGSSQRLRRLPTAPPAPLSGAPPAGEPPSPSAAALKSALAPSVGPSTPLSGDSLCSGSEALSRGSSAKHGAPRRHRFMGFLPGLASPGLYAGGAAASAIVWSST